MQDSDFEWFVDNYERLYKEYGNAYLAIKDRCVLGAYPSYATGVKETQKEHELGSFIVQQCNGSSSAYTAHIWPIISVE